MISTGVFLRVLAAASPPNPAPTITTLGVTCSPLRLQPTADGDAFRVAATTRSSGFLSNSDSTRRSHQKRGGKTIGRRYWEYVRMRRSGWTFANHRAPGPTRPGSRHQAQYQGIANTIV